jgi:hypothetical protein
MVMNTKNPALLMFAALLITACAGDGPSPAAEDPGSDAHVTASAVPDALGEAHTPGRRYPSRTGVIETRADMIGDTRMTEYFEDFGGRTARYTVTRVELFGTESVTRTAEILDDGWLISYDLDEKRGTKMRLRPSFVMPSNGPSFPAVKDAEQALEMGLKPLGARTVLGRQADGFEMEVMGMRMCGWVWEGIPLYTELYMVEDGDPVVMEVVSLQFDVAVDQELFRVPGDVVLEDISL